MHIRLAASTLVLVACGDDDAGRPMDAGIDIDAAPVSDALVPVDAAPDASPDAPEAPGTCGTAIEARLQAGRVLVLTGNDVITLGTEPCSLSRVCIRDTAGLRIDGTAQLTITGSAPSVLAGAGVGSIDGDVARLDLDFAVASSAYVVIENQVAPFELDLGAASNALTIVITGSAGLTVSGVADTITYGGNPAGFPACP